MSRGGGGTVRVLWFASLSDLTGVRDEVWDVRPGDTVDAIWRRAAERHPGLDARRGSVRVAGDAAWLEWDSSVEGLEELAFLPPVSGG